MRVAIIPARGGSKRIPGKNIKLFCGEPMIARSIRAANKSGAFDRVIVSTDDSQISDIALQHGAEAPFTRPASLADDYAVTADVIAHAVNWLIDHAETPEYVCCIYPTAPLLQAADLKGSLTALQSGDWNYVFSATTYAYPVYRSISVSCDGKVSMLFPEHARTRSQDLPECWHDAGQFYWGRTLAWTKKEPIFSERSTIYPIPRMRTIDIDTPEDWEYAETAFRVLEGK